jgi:benzoate-CoA ligase
MNAAEYLLGPDALARHGERTALICGDERLSYAQFAAQVERAAAAFTSLGLGAGERVLFLMRDTPEFAAAWLGALRCGAIAVALNGRIAEQDYRHVLADTAARLVLVEEVFAAARPDLADELAGSGRLVVAGGPLVGASSWRARLRDARATPPFDASADSPAFMLYSSGTTGRPKGILHAHRSVTCVGASFRAFGLGRADRVFATSKLFFAYGLEHGLLAPLASGACAILCAEWPDVAAVVDIVTRHQPTALFSVPTLYRRLAAEPPTRLDAFKAVQRFVSAGERLSPQLVSQWRAAVGGELLNLYGMSETFCACMVTPPGSSDGVRTGMPLDAVEVRLEDAILWIRHPALASGYANLPRETSEQFREGWFCTRDLFVRDAEGYYVHKGRSDELVKIAGQWVQPAELEQAAALEPAVAEVACVSVPDADGLERLALFVTACGDPAAALQAASAACARALPQHKRPKWVRAVAELPRTASGKVQRYKLREILARELAGGD